MRRLHLCFICGVMLLLSGCGSVWDAAKKTSQVMMDPDVKVGEPADQLTELTYSMYATSDVNTNAAGDATPLELVVFQLEDDSKFLAADYDSLVTDHEKALGSNYVDHSDYTMMPEQFKFIETFEIEEDTKYIGILANYNDPEEAQWKKVVKIKPIGREYHLLMYFTEQEVILDKVE